MVRRPSERRNSHGGQPPTTAQRSPVAGHPADGLRWCWSCACPLVTSPRQSKPTNRSQPQPQQVSQFKTQPLPRNHRSRPQHPRKNFPTPVQQSPMRPRTSSRPRRQPPRSRQNSPPKRRCQPQSPSSNSRLVVVANNKQPKEVINKETLQSQLGSPLAASGINPFMTHLILNRKHSTKASMMKQDHGSSKRSNPAEN